MKYYESRKETSRIFKKEKRAYTKNILEEAEKYHKEHNTRQLHKTINTIKGGYKKCKNFLKKEN